MRSLQHALKVQQGASLPIYLLPYLPLLWRQAKAHYIHASMSAKEFRWVPIASSVEEIFFGANGIAEVMAGDKKICVARHGGGLFAFAHKCPHASGHFAEGFIDALGNVVCPLHRYKFCMKNGRNVSGEGYYLKNWPVEVRADGVYVGLEKDRLFGLF